MIQEFHVSNFYSIRERISINFLPSTDDKMLDYYTYEVKPGLHLLKLGVIYGANASGKTKILEAITFFRSFVINRPGDKLKAIGFFPFLLDNDSRQRNSSMGMTFFIDGEKYVMECEFNSQGIISEQLIVFATSRPTLLYNRTYNSETGKITIAFGTKIGLSKKSKLAIEGNTTINCSVMAAFGQSNTEASRLDKVYNYFSNNVRQMLSPGMPVMDYVKRQLRESPDGSTKSFLLQILKASDFNIVDLNISKNEDAAISEDLIFQHSGDGGNFSLSEELESAGTRRFLGMSIILYELIHQNSFFPIDEVETSIHYELFSYFIKVFLANSEGTSQLLMTTHDVNLLDEDFIRRDVVWFTVKNAKGATSIQRLSSVGLHKTMSVYNAYKQGKLVELPFLGSIFLNN